MNVIIAGEESGIEREAFAALGHNAWSCDLKPTRRPGQHWQGSWRDIEWASFDLAITHPECTHLAVSGARWFAEKRADGRQQAAIAEFLYLANAPVYASCTEQPVSIMSSLYRKPDQIIQPWQFGRWETKALCYWLRNLPPWCRCTGRWPRRARRWAYRTTRSPRRGCIAWLPARSGLRCVRNRSPRLRLRWRCNGAARLRKRGLQHEHRTR